MTIRRIATAALIAASGLAITGAAIAAPASNLAGDQQVTQRTDSAATPVYHRGYHHYGYYNNYNYYRPYRPYYYAPPYYAPYGYYGGPSLNFGIQIR